MKRLQVQLFGAEAELLDRRAGGEHPDVAAVLEAEARLELLLERLGLVVAERGALRHLDDQSGHPEVAQQRVAELGRRLVGGDLAHQSLEW